MLFLALLTILELGFSELKSLHTKNQLIKLVNVYTNIHSEDIQTVKTNW